jgi:hypothetical protein
VAGLLLPIHFQKHPNTNFQRINIIFILPKIRLVAKGVLNALLDCVHDYKKKKKKFKGKNIKKKSELLV